MIYRNIQKEDLKMEKYRKTVIIRVILLSMLGIFDAFGADGEEKSSEIFEFQCGLTTALGILAIVIIIRYCKALLG